MSATFEALERARNSLYELIAAAAAEAEATGTNAAQAAEQAAELAYQRGLEAGKALGRDAMKAEALAIIETQCTYLRSIGLRDAHGHALLLLIKEA